MARTQRVSLVQTACREVHEETGWLVDPKSLRPLGWLHFEHLREQPVDHPWPHPDFLQVVYTGRASDRDRGADVEWTDTEGYELSSQRMTLEDAAKAVRQDRLAVALLRMLRPDLCHAIGVVGQADDTESLVLWGRIGRTQGSISGCIASTQPPNSSCRRTTVAPLAG